MNYNVTWEIEFTTEQNDLKLMPFYSENLALANNDGKK